MTISRAPTFASSSTTSPATRMPFSLRKFVSKKQKSGSEYPKQSSSRSAFIDPSPRMNPSPRASDHADMAPPAYSPSSSSAAATSSMQTTNDSPYAFLTQFDTVFLIDDSGSMAGRNWRETSAALRAVTPICTAHDADGVDVYFLNHRNSRHAAGGYTNINTTAGVEGLFNSVRPFGGTPTGTRLHQILKPYLAQVEDSIERQAHDCAVSLKPLNIIVITDGVPSDDVEATIVQAAKKLDAWGAEPWQVGIQFFQVGQEPEAAEDLQELDDALSTQHQVRDIVDTVPWTGDQGETLTADLLLKVVLGSVTRRLDRKNAAPKRPKPSYRLG